uniref:Uncharacterized protein n=1 Tax=Lepeophtheirus salmonis TaxID=72036 RepID=A0A0K2TG77_LEPSM
MYRGKGRVSLLRSVPDETMLKFQIFKRWTGPLSAESKMNCKIIKVTARLSSMLHCKENVHLLVI